jgi:acetoin:2,6-dichlorophenolindophenol oxidoreductase subunit beta
MAQVSFSEAVHSALLEAADADTDALFFFSSTVHEDEAFLRALKRAATSDRVRELPGSGAFAVGIALGAAHDGRRVIWTVDDPVLLGEAAEALSSQAASRHFLSNGQHNVPLVIRYRGLACAAEHAFAQCPGLNVAVPSTPYDAKGLLRSALTSEKNPVPFVDAMELSAVEGEVASGAFTLPFGVASQRRKGTQLTVVASGKIANVALAACERAAGEDGIDAELIDLRTLSPLDSKTVLESLAKTGRILLCSGAPGAAHALNEIALRIHDSAFDELDAPIRRVQPAETHRSANPALLTDLLPDEEKILESIRALVKE